MITPVTQLYITTTYISTLTSPFQECCVGSAGVVPAGTGGRDTTGEGSRPEAAQVGNLSATAGARGGCSTGRSTFYFGNQWKSAIKGNLCVML